MKKREYSRRKAERSIATTAIGIFTSFLLALTKGITGYLGNSYALIADAIESLSDIVTSMIVLLGIRVASRPPDHNHPYGHGKAEPLAGILVAFALFIAAIIIIVQSIHEIITPHHAPAPFTLIVLLAVIITKEILFRFVIKVGKEVESVAVKNDAWHHRSDAITSAAAFIGITIALIGGAGYEAADDWAALFASGIIIFNGYRLLQPALMEITDAAPDPEIINEVKEIILSVPGVQGVDKCYIRKMGFDFFVDVHVEVDGTLSVFEGHEIAHMVKDQILSHKQSITDVLVHIEPIRKEGGYKVSTLFRETILSQTTDKSTEQKNNL